MPRSNLCLFASTLLVGSPAVAQLDSDMPGSRDHPNVPRIEGTVIVGYSFSDYDDNEFIVGMENRELQVEIPEGETTRIVYLAPADMSPLGVLRNYESALGSLGQVTEVFSCRANTCYSNLGDVFIWESNRRISSSIEDTRYLYANRSYYRDQLYWYGTVETNDARYHVAVYAAVRTDREHSAATLGEGLSLIHLDIVEEADFDPTLAFISAEEMSAEIAETGHVALYGLYFDTDTAELNADSAPALEEMAKALQTTPGLAVYVVGHTDNEGKLEYNLDLSERRATSAVEALTNEYGVAQGRLTAIGVGPAAPVASNDTEDGRALNRRVELVAR